MASQEERLRALEMRIQSLERELAKASQPPKPAKPETARTVVPTLPPLAALEPLPSSPPLARRAASAGPQFDGRKVFGARILARAGILVLSLGVVFYLKLAYDNGWISIPGRVAIGVAGGLLLAATGEFLRRRNFDSVFAQVLAGGGAVIAYVTIYAAHALPDFHAALGWPLPLTITLLAATAAGLAGYALWRDLPALAGVAAAMAAILVAPAGSFDGLGLFFVAALEGAILVAAVWRGWGPIILTALVGSGLAHLVAATSRAIPEWATLASATAIAVLGLIAAQRTKASRDLARAAAVLATVILFPQVGLTLMRSTIPEPWAWAALSVGAACLGAALVLRRLAPSLAIVGTALILWWPFLHFHGTPWVPVVEALLGVTALALSPALSSKARFGSEIVGLGAFGLAVFTILPAILRKPLDAFNLGMDSGAAAIVLAASVASWALQRGAGADERPLRPWHLASATVASLVLALILLDEWQVAVAWGAFALLAASLGLALRDSELQFASFALFGCVVARIFVVDLATLPLPAKVLAFLVTGAFLLVGAFLFARQRKTRKASDSAETPE